MNYDPQSIVALHQVSLGGAAGAVNRWPILRKWSRLSTTAHADSVIGDDGIPKVAAASGVKSRPDGC